MSLPEVLVRLRAAEREAGRPEGSARLVAVTKGHTPQEIREHVLSHGLFPLGEARGQELRDKRGEVEALASELVEWHFIGALQSNKLRYLRGVKLIHTLTRADHAAELARLSETWGEAPGVLRPVHNGEAQTSGVAPAALGALYHQVTLMALSVRGLMVMAPEDDSAAAQRVFAETALRAHDLGLPELSMGMSDDYPAAIARGATLVRVGRALFS